MKKICILFMASFFALSSCTTFTKGDREPSSSARMFAPRFTQQNNKIFFEPGSPNYVDPSLNDDPVSPDQINKIQKELNELRNLEFSKIKPAQIATPDFDVAVKVFRLKIKQSMISYFNTVDGIKKDIRYTFSELMALKQAADAGGPGNLIAKQFEQDVKLKIPALHTKINLAYKKAYVSLMNLDGYADFIVKHNQIDIQTFYGKDIFKENKSSNYAEGLLGICETKICVGKLSVELENWQNFVRSLNQEITIGEFNGQTKWSSKPIDTSPHVTLALIDGANELINAGLKTNKDYSIVGALVKHTANAITTPVGLGLAILSAPVYLLEKLSTAAEAFFKLRVMKLELALKEIPLYDAEASVKGLRYGFQKYNMSLSNSAIYIHEGENKQELIGAAFLSAWGRAGTVLKSDEKIFTKQEMSDFVSAGWVNFAQVSQKYSIEETEVIFMNSTQKNVYLEQKNQYREQIEKNEIQKKLDQEAKLKQIEIDRENGKGIIYLESRSSSHKILIEDGIAYFLDWGQSGANIYVRKNISISNGNIVIEWPGDDDVNFIPSVLDPNVYNYYYVRRNTKNFNGLTPNGVYQRKVFSSTSPNFSFKNIINSAMTKFKFVNVDGEMKNRVIAIKDNTAYFLNWGADNITHTKTISITESQITIPWGSDTRVILIRNPREKNSYLYYYLKNDIIIEKENLFPNQVLEIVKDNSSQPTTGTSRN